MKVAGYRICGPACARSASRPTLSRAVLIVAAVVVAVLSSCSSSGGGTVLPCGSNYYRSCPDAQACVEWDQQDQCLPRCERIPADAGGGQYCPSGSHCEIAALAPCSSRGGVDCAANITDVCVPP